MSTADQSLAADDELWTLVEALVEGTLDDTTRQRLESRLRSDATARQFYVAYLDLHANLQWQTRGQSDRPASQNAIASASAAPHRPRPLIAASLAALISLATAAAVFVAVFMPRQPPEEAETPDLPVKPAGAVAVLIENGPAVWEAGSVTPKSGSYLLPGRLRLKSGVVEIAFERGGKMLLEGPSDLDVNSADHGFLHRGKFA